MSNHVEGEWAVAGVGLGVKVLAAGGSERRAGHSVTELLALFV